MTQNLSHIVLNFLGQQRIYYQLNISKNKSNYLDLNQELEILEECKIYIRESMIAKLPKSNNY